MTPPPAELITLARAVVSSTDQNDYLRALTHLHHLRTSLDRLEPELIGAARDTGASWQALAAVLGVASRQAAERRYLRLVPATADQAGSTREQRVQQLRDARAVDRAVDNWANDNTTALRRLAAQITTLDGLDPTSADDIARLDHALGDPDASALPALLAQARPHLTNHPALAQQVDTVTQDTARVRHQTQQQRDVARTPAGSQPAPSTGQRAGEDLPGEQ